MELYNKIDTQEKRAINRVKQPELSSICRSIRWNTATDKKRNGTFFTTKNNFLGIGSRSEMPKAGLGEIAHAVGVKWKELGVKGTINAQGKNWACCYADTLP